MALTNDELYGSGNHTSAGLKTGGSVKAVIPPVDVFDAGPLSVITWLLEKLRAAQAEDGTVNVITKNTAITSTNKVRVTYNVTVDADEADLSETLAANVDDNFS